MKRLLLYVVIVSAVSVLSVGQAQYKVLWAFTGSPSGDGAQPVANLVFDKMGNLYGTTRIGGNSNAVPCFSGCGTVFRLSPNPDGTWTNTILYEFCSDYEDAECIDGALPQGGLILDRKGNLYGTTNGGGSQACPYQSIGCGTVFELSPPTSPGEVWTESVLYSFCGNNSDNKCLDGAEPTSALTSDLSGNLYGTTQTGGNGRLSVGAVFELSPSRKGWTEKVIYSFCSIGQGNACPDGQQPMGGVSFDKSGNLYGTTELGGSKNLEGDGIVYKLSQGPGGWTEKVILQGRDKDGGAPLGAPNLDSMGRIYGTYSGGGTNGAGGVFRIVPNGGHILFSFNGTNGESPAAGVLLDSRKASLYGTTSTGGAAHGGTVFAISAPTSETVLYSFCSQPSCTDGSEPVASIIEDQAGNLYGTAKRGGPNDLGVVFEIITPGIKTRANRVGVRSLLSKRP